MWRSYSARRHTRMSVTQCKACSGQIGVSVRVAEEKWEIFYFSDSMQDKLQCEFYSAFNSYLGSYFNIDDFIKVELVDNMIRSSKRDRAAGNDGITAEHLLYSHPILAVLLSCFFLTILLLKFVPDAFGTGIIVPFIKGDDLDTTNADNYRAINY